MVRLLFASFGRSRETNGSSFIPSLKCFQHGSPSIALPSLYVYCSSVTKVAVDVINPRLEKMASAIIDSFRVCLPISSRCVRSTTSERPEESYSLCQAGLWPFRESFWSSLLRNETRCWHLRNTWKSDHASWVWPCHMQSSMVILC